MYKIVYSEDILQHHGILGQKWGIRRYQNYDGSYTQAGVKRYNTSKENYEYTKNAYKSAKKLNGHTVTNPNTGEESTINISKSEMKSAKTALKTARKQMNKDYRHLEVDRRADKGKELYRSGKTITGNHRVSEALSTIGAASLYFANSEFGEALITKGNKNVKMALNTIGAVSLAGAAAKEVSNYYQDRNLRAYYGHTSNY